MVVQVHQEFVGVSYDQEQQGPPATLVFGPQQGWEGGARFSHHLLQVSYLVFVQV